MTAQGLRQQMLSARNALSPAMRKSASIAIKRTLCALEQWKNARSIALYRSFGSEVNTLSLIDLALDKGKTVFLPVCQPNYRLIFTRYDHSIPLEPKAMGLLEPAADAITPIDPGLIDLCLVPGLIFDRWAHRIGYGKGYYDRFLPTLPDACPTIGLAYDMQVLKNTDIPQNKTDVPLSLIITEIRIYP